ncbi:hypothetical protein PsorP6_007226 [Peronosclerospora sorghi]|uniref:Uncharacterized protein n=1 Tax=Peronosclerospora sorghi TaxID=230839 RepID=A0ACC0WAK3_9STRA|nr:hypothetical protein PsorP6_007226 [Peronosclerospora sorghi]
MLFPNFRQVLDPTIKNQAENDNSDNGYDENSIQDKTIFIEHNLQTHVAQDTRMKLAEAFNSRFFNKQADYR